MNLIAHLPLDLYPKVAMIIFMGVFVLVTYRTLREPHHAMAHNAALPLDDEETNDA